MGNPYENCKIYGPYAGKSGRLRIAIQFPKEYRLLTAYSRYLMECHLGRILTPDEHVHHINGDKTDDRLENLQVLRSVEHQKAHGAFRNPPKMHLPRSYRNLPKLDFVCFKCGVVFSVEDWKSKSKKQLERCPNC